MFQTRLWVKTHGFIHKNDDALHINNNNNNNNLTLILRAFHEMIKRALHDFYLQQFNTGYLTDNYLKYTMIKLKYTTYVKILVIIVIKMNKKLP